jgi:hypothetical protein
MCLKKGPKEVKSGRSSYYDLNVTINADAGLFFMRSELTFDSKDTDTGTEITVATTAKEIVQGNGAAKATGEAAKATGAKAQ